MAMFVVTLERMGQWDWSRDMREQDGWDAHAEFMDGLADEGFILLGGPLPDDTRRTMHIVQAVDAAEVERRFGEDPWSGTHLRVDSIQPWEVLLRAPGYR